MEMNKKRLKQRQARRLAAIYTLMVSAIIVVVALLVFIMLGYRFDSDAQKIEQTGLVQFDSSPSGATVEIDKKALSQKTSTKSVVSPRTHEFSIWREGYETWWKQLDIAPGTVTWLDYARLVPKDRKTDSVHTFEKLDDIAFAPFGRFALAHTEPSSPQFELYDLRNADEVKKTTLTLPGELLAGSDDAEGVHSYQIDEWDQSGRYILIKHVYNDQTEWLLADRENEKNTKNISRIVDLPIADAQISGSGGTRVFVLTEETVRLANLTDGTLSRAYASKVKSFSLYGSDVITFIGLADNDSGDRVLGLVRRSDSSPHVIKTVPATDQSPIAISTTNYYKKDYVVTSVGASVEILAGEYPGKDRQARDTLLQYASFKSTESVAWLQTSGNGRFVVAQGENGYMSYDLERDTTSSPIRFAEPTAQKLRWLDNYNFWTTEGGQLVMEEFDGTNKHVIAQTDGAFEASFDHNFTYLYSIAPAENGYSLQRVQMILDK